MVTFKNQGSYYHSLYRKFMNFDLTVRSATKIKFRHQNLAATHVQVHLVFGNKNMHKSMSFAIPII